jgi:hypothetical protein
MSSATSIARSPSSEGRPSDRRLFAVSADSIAFSASRRHLSARVIASIAWFTASVPKFLDVDIGAQFPTAEPRPDRAACTTQALIDQALAQRFAGILEYVAPTEMKVHDTGKVTLKIAPIDLANEVNAEIVALQASRGGQSETSDVRLTSVMKAELAGSSGFHVLPTGPIEQAVSSTEPTTWGWSVEALDGDDWFSSRHAIRQLNIALTAVLNVAGKDRDRSIGEPWERKINVTVDWPTWPHESVEAGMDLWPYTEVGVEKRGKIPLWQLDTKSCEEKAETIRLTRPRADGLPDAMPFAVCDGA